MHSSLLMLPQAVVEVGSRIMAFIIIAAFIVLGVGSVVNDFTRLTTPPGEQDKE